jgi:alpha-L-fucosidase
VFWFDWWIQHDSFKPYLPRFAAYYYNAAREWGPDWDQSGAAINHKFNAYPEGTSVFDIERGQLAGIRPSFWQTDTSVSKNSWGYIHNHDYKTAGSIVGDLVDIVSKNGALLLNIGPRPDGTIPEPEQAMLREIGQWLAINGDAIYATRPWKIFGEGPTQVAEGEFTDTKRQSFTSQDIRFTTSGATLYAIALGWPDQSWTIEALGTASAQAPGRIASVELLGSDAQLSWSQNQQALTVAAPAERPCDHAYALKIAFEG